MLDKINILVSGCLIGLNCKYDGGNNYCEALLKLREKYNLIPICPEIFGGMSTPRQPSEISGSITDKSVICYGSRVVNKLGEDVTEYFERGAKEALKLAKFYDCKCAILKERSPSCGHGKIYDGTFSKKIIDGDGITARLFLENGIRVIGETELVDL